MELGACHSMALTSKLKCYTWGWNDCNQTGRPRPDFIEEEYNKPDHIYENK